MVESASPGAGFAFGICMEFYFVWIGWIMTIKSLYITEVFIVYVNDLKLRIHGVLHTKYIRLLVNNNHILCILVYPA